MADNQTAGNRTGGMSKGCMIALIIVGIIIVLLIITMIVCYVYREDLARAGAGVMVTSIKNEVAKNPPEGVDTVQFDAMADSFVVKLDEAKLPTEEYGQLISTMQGIMADKQVSADEVREFEDMMVTYFPDLESMRGGEMTPPDTTAVPDTAGAVDTL
jgi:hypothetical protein